MSSQADKYQSILKKDPEVIVKITHLRDSLLEFLETERLLPESYLRVLKNQPPGGFCDLVNNHLRKYEGHEEEAIVPLLALLQAQLERDSYGVPCLSSQNARKILSFILKALAIVPRA